MINFSDQPSDSGPVVKKPAKKYQNTYKLEPDTRFPVGKVETIAEDVLRVGFLHLDANAGKRNSVAFFFSFCAVNH